MSGSSTSSRNFISMANKYDRIVLLVDMDCFYCQVEEKLDPSLKGQPLAVVQYNAWKGGGIIAVNYAARAKGVTRHMRGDEAKEQCAEIVLVKVPNVREKADLTKYREAGKNVANVLQRFTPLLERASVDEAYLDITDAVNKRLAAMNEGTFVLQPTELVNTFAVGFQTIGEFVTNITTSYTNPLLDNDDFYRNFQESDIPAVRQSNIRLLIGASIASEIRAAVKAETGYECSAGIAHNKILAKLACGMNKPNKQTLLPLAQIRGLFATLPVGKIKGLGAKYGEEVCERLGIRYLGQLLKFTEIELQQKFDEKNGSWLYNICRGIDLEAVTPRFYSKSIGCCKKFPGRNNITGLRTLQHWLKELANEISDRLDKDIIENNRRAKQMVVNFTQEFNGEEISSSRSAPLYSYDTEMLARNSFQIIKANTKQFFRPGSESVINNPIKFLGISVGKFETISNSQNNIQEMFAQQAAKKKKNSSNMPIEDISKDKLDNETGDNSNAAVPEQGKKLAANRNKSGVQSFFVNAMKKQTLKEFRNEDNIRQSNTSKGSSALHSSYHNSFFKNIFIKAETLKYEQNKVSNSSDFVKSYSPVRDSKSPTTLLDEWDRTSTARSDINEPSNTREMQQISFFSEMLSNHLAAEESVTNEENKVINNLNISENKNTDSCDDSCLDLNNLINDLETIKNVSNDTQRDENLNTSNELCSTEHGSKRKFNDILNENESSQKDYRSEYAEFAIPEFQPQFLQFTNCPTCAAKIPNDSTSIQMHQDHHFAQLLSQQQRHEFREETRLKINTAKSSPKIRNKKLKQSPITNCSKKSANSNIIKFLKPASTIIIAKEDQTLEAGAEVCAICRVPIKLEELSEHKDYHAAKELQKKLNQLDVHTVQVTKKPVPQTPRRNLNTSLKATSRQSKLVVKPITQFFTQPNA